MHSALTFCGTSALLCAWPDDTCDVAYVASVQCVALFFASEPPLMTRCPTALASRSVFSGTVQAFFHV